MRVLLTFLFALCFLQDGLSQKEAHNWYFGEYAGINFNTSPPTALYNGQLNTTEGCATISTPAGRLLFYTDGNRIWDSTHNAMPNGIGLKGSFTTTQSAIIVPMPDSPHVFYVFTLDQIYGTEGLHYSVVNMKLNGGKGDVVSSMKNIKLQNQYPTCEKITAAKHANGKDYWILTPQFGTDSFYAYRLTASGLNPVPIKYSTGYVLRSNNVAFKLGYLKTSPDGSKIAYVNYSTDSGVIADFDASTGRISNAWVFHAPFAYGLEFSAETKFLYVSVNVSRIYQYDLSSASRSAFIASRKTVDSVTSGGPAIYGLQLGPDRKIYVASYRSAYLSVIHAPDSSGFDCRPQKNYLYLTPGISMIGLPNFIPDFFQERRFQVSGKCRWDSTFFTLNDTRFIDSVKWDFGDTASGNANFSSKINGASHIYNTAGEYTVKLYYLYGNKMHVTASTFKINPTVKPMLGRDTILCNKFSLWLSAHNKYRFTSYTWNGNILAETLTVSQKGQYALYTVDSLGCSSADSINVMNPLVRARIQASDSFRCLAGNTFRLNDTSIYTDDISYKYAWDFGDATFGTDSIANKSYAIPGTFNVKLSVLSKNGCRDSAFQQLTVSSQPSANFFVDSDTQCFSNHEFGFTAVSNSKNYHWDFGDGLTGSGKTPKHKYAAPGSYKAVLTIHDTMACQNRDSSMVTTILPDIRLSVNRDTQCFARHEFIFTASGTASGRRWEFGDGSKDSLTQVKHTYAAAGIYKVRLNALDAFSCSGADSAWVTLVLPLAQLSVNTDTQCISNNRFLFSAKAGKIKYNWNFGNGNTDSGQAVARVYSGTGNFAVILFTLDSFQCETADTLYVSVLESPSALFDFDIDACRNSVKFFNKSMKNVNDYWQVDTGIIKRRDISYSFPGAGQYKVVLTVEDSSGRCRDTLERLLDIPIPKKQDPLMIPNVFTPGSDNFNDCYRLGGIDAECGDKGEIRIYNRWGVQVFKGDLPEACWNGKLDNEGADLPEGTYYYILSLEYHDEQGFSKNVSGNGVIHLVR